MPNSSKTLIDLETKFWQAMVDNDSETATALLAEPALIVGGKGAMQFDHAGYRKMASQGPQVLTSFELDDIQVVFPNEDTAVLTYRATQGVAPRGNKEAEEFEEMNDSSTWVRAGKAWKCVLHTETPVATEAAH
ncbi:nuclear transport factor 2 family protein [uncultured Ramlibacter sp.]|uniref:nuclear transport factor 2 family protein n=1 Tax=uncultured Ramlibacter sp. TaxID=260755 RepID=UPI0026108F59|nr:nuclear transport factor 2 family protein [uncultured Ramlibacter sp.]